MTKLNIKQYSLISIICICFTSCYTVSDISIGILEPAEISLPTDIRKVSIYPGPSVNIALRTQLDSLDNLRLDKNVLNDKLHLEYITGLAEILDYSPRLDSIVIGRTEVKQEELGTISWTEIIKICKKDSTDALIILNWFYLRDTLVISKLPDVGCYVEYRIYNNPVDDFLSERT